MPSALERTFVHAAGVGEQTERSLWAQGSETWDDFLLDPRRYRVGSASRDALVKEIERSRDALWSGVHQYFRKKLKQKHAWRAFDAFADSCAYVDIETDGTSRKDCVTMVGVAHSKGFDCFVQGENIEAFRDFISRYSLIVTFFGTGFDIPVIEKRFPLLNLDQIHIDLCPMFRSLGVRGGLKRIEKQFGIERGPEIDGLSGYDAIHLWRKHLRGYDGPLDRLIAYNRADCENMIPLMRRAFDMALEDLAFPISYPKA